MTKKGGGPPTKWTAFVMKLIVISTDKTDRTSKKDEFYNT